MKKELLLLNLKKKKRCDVMDNKNSDIIILSLGLSYLIISIFLFVNHVNINAKFFFIIAISSFNVSIYELINAIMKSTLKINSTLLNKIYNNSTDSELLAVENDINKIKRKIKILQKVNVYCKLITYIFIFISMIVIPFKKIPIEQLQFLTNIFSIVGFSLIFISIYINSDIESIEEKTLNGFDNIERKYINKKIQKSSKKPKKR